jgi:excisionase family DNA binding protein
MRHELNNSNLFLENQFTVKKEWLSSQEAAEYLGITVGSLRNKVCNGLIKPSGKLGRLNRFHIRDLQELLSGSKPK